MFEVDGDVIRDSETGNWRNWFYCSVCSVMKLTVDGAEKKLVGCCKDSWQSFSVKPIGRVYLSVEQGTTNMRET